MPLISEDYRELNRKLHESNAAYGTSSYRWVVPVSALAQDFGARSILDYGCGKGELKKGLEKRDPYPPEFPRPSVFEYDPAIEGKEELPKPADLLVCTDVLEHIEPEHIDHVLDHIRDLTLKGGYITIATTPAKKVLEDGRNAHVLLRSPRWWLNELHKRFEIIHWMNRQPIVAFVATREKGH